MFFIAVTKYLKKNKQENMYLAYSPGGPELSIAFSRRLWDCLPPGSQEAKASEFRDEIHPWKACPAMVLSQARFPWFPSLQNNPLRCEWVPGSTHRLDQSFCNISTSQWFASWVLTMPWTYKHFWETVHIHHVTMPKKIFSSNMYRIEPFLPSPFFNSFLYIELFVCCL